MKNLSSKQLKLRSIKRAAHRLQKEQGITKGEALEVTALNEGYSNWRDCRAKILGDEADKPVYLHQLDRLKAEATAKNIIGFSDDSSIQIRQSYAYLDEDFIFESLNIPFDKRETMTLAIFRKGLRRYFKDVELRSQSHLFIAFLLEAPKELSNLIADLPAFFEAERKRHKRIFDIDLRITNEHQSIDDIQDWIDSYNRDVLDPIFKDDAKQ